MVVAPAAMARSTTSTRKSGSVRAASSAENSTSSQRSRAYSMAPVETRTTSAGVIFSLNSRWMGLVARKTCTRLRGAGASALRAASMSGRLARASAQITGPSICRAMASTAWKSPGEATGKPASMTSTPSEASARATCSFWERFMLAPGACSPSRSVVSKTITRSSVSSIRVTFASALRVMPPLRRPIQMFRPARRFPALAASPPRPCAPAR